MKQAIVVRTDISMGTGKLAAQVAHASLSAYEKADDSSQHEWKSQGQKKVVLKAPDEQTIFELAEIAANDGLPNATIRDAGHTQLEPGTVTTVGIGPGSNSAIDRVTGSLSLL